MTDRLTSYYHEDEDGVLTPLLRFLPQDTPLHVGNEVILATGAYRIVGTAEVYKRGPNGLYQAMVEYVVDRGTDWR